MSVQTELLEIGKEKLTQMKVFLDDLEVQLALGKAEAKDAFERERKNFLKYVNQQKAQFKENGKAAGEQRQLLKEKFEELEAQLSKEFAASKRQFDQQKKKTLHAIHDLEFTLKEVFGDISLSLEAKLDAFKGKLDAYRIQLALGEFEDVKKLQVRKEELARAVAEIREKLQKEANAGEKMDFFADEISESFNHMKKAFSELFS